MNIKPFTLAALAALLCTGAFAKDGAKTKDAKKSEIVEHLENHFKIYGFVRNYFSFDSRENKAGTGDLFEYLPKDNEWNMTPEEAETSELERIDLNAQPNFRFLSLTSRVGLDVSGYQIQNMTVGAKIEADFYAGLSAVKEGTAVTGTAQLRLRQAFLTLGWKQENCTENLKIGQAWHPVAADLPDVFSLNAGSPFNPFSRTPQIQFNGNFGKVFGLTAAAIWQMQYTSAGPNGACADYIKWSCTPEVYFGLNFKSSNGFLARVGVDVLSIKPRKNDKDAALDKQITVKVKDRLTTVSPFVYMQYVAKSGKFAVKAKTIFAEAGEHMNLNGGYGVSAINEDGSWEYTPTRNSSSWVNITFGKKVQGIIFAGYVKNFGTKDPIVDKDHYYFSKNSFNNMNQMYRLTPTVVYNIGKLALGLEYEVTSVQYGKGDLNLSNALVSDNLHWVTNHRVQAMIKFSF